MFVFFNRLNSCANQFLFNFPTFARAWCRPFTKRRWVFCSGEVLVYLFHIGFHPTWNPTFLDQLSPRVIFSQGNVFTLEDLEFSKCFFRSKSVLFFASVPTLPDVFRPRRVREVEGKRLESRGCPGAKTDHLRRWKADGKPEWWDETYVTYVMRLWDKKSMVLLNHNICSC